MQRSVFEPIDRHITTPRTGRLRSVAADPSLAAARHRGAEPGRRSALSLARLDGAAVAPATDSATADWDLMFCAVQQRLRQLAAEAPAATRFGAQPASGPSARGASARFAMPTGDGVLECVSAMQRLHAMLLDERRLGHAQQALAADARRALARAGTELRRAQAEQAQASHHARHDELTALPNRLFLRERLEQALAQAAPQRQRLALLFLDLDGFKPINDRHGHATGDALLRVVAARLDRSVRAGDLVSRLGGDEFVCLLEDAPEREPLRRFAAQLFDTVAAPVQLGAVRLAVRASIGIAMCPSDGDTVEALLRSADAAMYDAKRRQTGYGFANHD